ncbi:MAG: FkbM family methyltransferase [Syntrophobacterales bacterium]|nr:MAG: FkbM family methyltransferase [Syntrophobacterales bacterium]
MRYLNLIRNISNWPLHIKHKFGLTTSDPIVFTAKNDIRFEVPDRLYHEFKEIFLENAYTVGQQKRITRTDPTIIDIGANVGFFSVFALSKFPKCSLYSYEPVESNFKQLSRNRELNRDRNFNCFNLAVCGHKGTIEINFDITDQFTTSATIVNTNNDNLTSMEVPCLRLRDIFDENNIEKCDFLKLDCEGAEHDVLYNTPAAYLARIDQMAIEVHQGKNEGENLESLRNFLNRNDFDLFQFNDKLHMLWAHRT